MSKTARLEGLRAMVAGGSIGGLCAGLALRGIGAQVEIFERFAGRMATRGAGIVVQRELLQLFQRYGLSPLPMTSCSGRRHLSPDGGDGRRQPMPQSFTSWESIYLNLRAAFPDDHYHAGRTIGAFESEGELLAAEIVSHGRATAGLLVCADGAQSEMRRRLLPDIRSQYAGYVAWRGTVCEDAVRQDLADFFDDSFTFSEARSGGHMLVYLIPGLNMDTTPGRRVLNWVWYVHADDDELDVVLTDRSGHRHHNSLPQGEAGAAVVAQVKALARREVHPRMAELVEATPDPFLQAIMDVTVPRTVFGRACLLGDAAFVVRPHTAGATAKAAREAMALADLLQQADGDVLQALPPFEKEQLRYGNELHRYGVDLAARWTRVR